MSNLGIAVLFRHTAEEGVLKPLSPVAEYVPGRKSRFNGRPLPVSGYLCAFDGAEYTFDIVWFQAAELRYDGQPDRPASIKTDRTCMCECSVCGSQPWPAWCLGGKEAKDGSQTQCPICGSVSTVRDMRPGSDEFFELLGDLRTPLEEAARDGFGSGIPFAFNEVYLGAQTYGQIEIAYKRGVLGVTRDVTAKPETRQEAIALLSKVAPDVEGETGDDRSARLGKLLDDAAFAGSASSGDVRVKVATASDSRVPRDIAVRAVWAGRYLRPLTGVTLADIRQESSVDYCMDPEVAFGCLDKDDAEKGVQLGGGSLAASIKLVGRRERRTEVKCVRY